MGDITGTPIEKLAKLTIANQLEDELLTSYNNITLKYDDIYNTKLYLQQLSSNFTPDPELPDKIQLLMESINDYLPIYENTIQEDNTFLEEIKTLLINSYDYLPENSNLLNMFDINSFEDITNLEELPTTFIDNLTSNSIGLTFNNIISDFTSQEFGLGSILAIAEHNMGLSSISENLNNIITISETLVNDFSDVANLESIQGLLNILPTQLSNLSLDTLGNLDITGILESIGIPVDSFTDLLNIKDIMNNVIGNVTGQLANVTNGIGGCACSVVISGSNLSGIVDSIQKIQELGSPVLGQLNSTMNSILNDLPISNYSDVDSLKTALLEQIDLYKNISNDNEATWNDIITT